MNLKLTNTSPHIMSLGRVNAGFENGLVQRTFDRKNI